jgi:hypothetical protein
MIYENDLINKKSCLYPKTAFSKLTEDYANDKRVLQGSKDG